MCIKLIQNNKTLILKFLGRINNNKNELITLCNKCISKM